MKQHILIEKAFRYSEPVATPIPENLTYNVCQGYWVDSQTGKAMMLSDNPIRTETKKADRETGEDQKGE